MFCGDHVWIGQNAFLLKGTQIGSGSIVGAMAVVAGKKIPSNTSWGGNPARQLGDRLFFTSPCVHPYTPEKTRKSQYEESNAYIYSAQSEEVLSFDEIDRRLCECKDARERLDYLNETVISNTAKNRLRLPPLGHPKTAKDS
ncbi:MAG: hypothetical protein Q4C50_08605 [Eubacteriales bacterium]|nr:hypothetical protein [Eubacteriales bacterium]